MLVVDTSAFISLAVGGAIEETVDEFHVITTRSVMRELEQTADYDDRHGSGAADVAARRASFEVVDANGERFVTSRIDAGEASCVAAARELDADFCVTDDYRALPEIEALVTAPVVVSPIVLRALVKRERLTEEDARAIFERIAEGRDWLGAPIHRYASHLFE